MDLQNEKCVMVIDEQLPLGIIANTAAVMGITLGKAMPEVVGADVRDESGHKMCIRDRRTLCMSATSWLFA